MVTSKTDKTVLFVCFQGSPMPSRQLAKMAVALKMYEMLYKSGMACYFFKKEDLHKINICDVGYLYVT